MIKYKSIEINKNNFESNNGHKWISIKTEIKWMKPYQTDENEQIEYTETNENFQEKTNWNHIKGRTDNYSEHDNVEIKTEKNNERSITW